jgi:glycosyltransferase involved in cell wall biosynthesis
MNVLFLHQNFPGQFVHIARDLHADPGNTVRAITDAANTRPRLVPDIRYRFDAAKALAGHPLGSHFSARVARGEAVARAMQALRAEGFVPDVVLGHMGWGETLFVKDVFPDARLAVYAEYYYGTASGSDVTFDPEFPSPDPFAARLGIRARNAAFLTAMESAEYGVAPTQWQGSRFPEHLRRRIAVLHDGIETRLVAPKAAARFRLPSGRELTREDEVLTFVNRNLEPYRGYHIFMRALPEILKARPNAQAVIVGGDGVSYGPHPPAGTTWKKKFLAEVRDRLPMERVHFTGKVPYADFIALMQLSRAHLYLTYPFVLSWSMLEAMSAGAPLIASRTPPVEEVVEDGRTGLLVDFFDREALAARAIEVLANPARYKGLGEAGRAHIVARYDLETVWRPRWRAFVRHLAETPARPA